MKHTLVALLLACTAFACCKKSAINAGSLTPLTPQTKHTDTFSGTFICTTFTDVSQTIDSQATDVLVTHDTSMICIAARATGLVSSSSNAFAAIMRLNIDITTDSAAAYSLHPDSNTWQAIKFVHDSIYLTISTTAGCMNGSDLRFAGALKKN